MEGFAPITGEEHELLVGLITSQFATAPKPLEQIPSCKGTEKPTGFVLISQ